MSSVVQEFQPKPIKVLNANVSKINRLTDNELNDIWDVTLDVIIDTLLSSYGECPLLSLVVYEGSNNVSVFTTDGIHKLKTLEFISPIQTYLSDHIRYVGECIEKFARDGTTTGMLFTCWSIKYFNQLIFTLESICCKYTRFSKRKIKKYIKNIVSKYITKYLNILKQYIKKHRSFLQDEHYSLQYKKEIISTIIKLTTREYSELLIEPINEIFSNIPPIFYEYFTYTRSPIETDELISIYTPEYEYESSCMLQHGHEHFNDLSKLEFHSKNCNLIILPKTFYDTDIQYKQLIEQAIEELEENQYLVIFNKHIDRNIIQHFVNQYKDKKILFVQYVNHQKEILESGIELEGLIYSNKNQSMLVKDVEIKITVGNIYINNLFDLEKINGSKCEINKWINEKYNNQLFLKWKSELEYTIEKLKKDYSNPYVNELTKEYTKLYKKFIIPKYPTIKIGGKVLEHLEMIDIVEDVLGSISIILKHGYIINPIEGMIGALNQHIKDITNEKVLLEKFETILQENRYAYKELNDIIEQLVILTLRKILDKLLVNIKNYVIHKSEYIDTKYINYKSIEEMLIRGKDAITKILRTYDVIVPGTVNVVDKLDK